jgi:hypothetical protein
MRKILLSPWIEEVSPNYHFYVRSVVGNQYVYDDGGKEKLPLAGLMIRRYHGLSIDRRFYGQILTASINVWSIYCETLQGAQTSIDNCLKCRYTDEETVVFLDKEKYESLLVLT